MKRGKRAAAVVLAIGLAVMGSIVSFTANDEDLVEGNCEGVIDGEAKLALTGTIKTTNVQVRMPIAVSFDIDPNVTVVADIAITASNNQIIAQASNYTIANISKAPLVVSITGVKTETGATEDTPTLVSTLNDLTGKNVMFTTGKSRDNIKHPSAAADNTRRWVTTTTVTIDSPYQVASTAGDNTLVPGGTLDMTLYGAAGTGWKNEDSFQVIPTLTIVPQGS